MRSGGDGGGGGTLELSAGRDLTLTAAVDVSGKSSGGDIAGDAGRAITLSGVLNAQANDVTGDGGSVDFVAGLAQVATLTVAANIVAPGGDNNGSGQDISLSGCGLTVEAGVKLDGHAGVNINNVSGGSDIDLISRTPMQLKGGSQYLAYPAGHVYTFHPPGQDPVIGAAVTFNPARTDRPSTTTAYANCPVCGDGVRATGEACDDGDLSGGDGCSANCTVEPGYTCVGDPSVCSPTCGDGSLFPPEQCDDGDIAAGDGCGPTCTVEPGWTCAGVPSICVQTCGDGITAPGEECDDNNLVSGDGCDANCRFTACGNGIATTGEECDDANTMNGDCCSSLCQYETAGSACATDGNGCTDDACNATGTCAHTSNTQPCADDGNVCTNDVCGGGTCTHPANPSPVPCASDGNSCTNDVCGGGVCTHPANTLPCADDGNGCTNDVCGGGTCTHPANTAPCNDGNACTQTDTCSNKVCVGANPVVCTALDQCHLAGTCAPASGVCSNPNKANGVACNDGNACTQTDTCQTGTCTGANPKICTALDQCHVAGTCAPGTGICSNPNKADGSTCNDANACTQTDTCQTGTCTGGNPKVCTPSDQCHLAGTSAPATGNCSNPVATNGTTCNDANVCTRQDVCTSGSCAGNTNICNDGIHQSTCGELCDDGNTTSGDGCDANCTPTACGNGIRTTGEQCDDGDTTNGDGCSSSCTVESGWQCSTGNPSLCSEVCGDGIQTPGEECEDGNVQPRDGCSPTCKLELCGALPATGCLLPVESAKASVMLKSKTTPDKDIFSWKWIKGAVTPKSLFGNPRLLTDYAVCLYDETAGVPQLKVSVTVPRAGFCKGRECWRISSTGFKYSNSAVLPDGKMKIVLKEGLTPGLAKIIVKGKGSHLILPTMPLAKSPRVRVQLRNSDGACWEANYSTASLNLPIEFKAKAD
jgi:cysteine-rich repeat protein